MKHQSYDPANGPFPPHIENSRIRLDRTGLDGGNDICFADGLLFLISSAEGGSLRICSADGAEPEVIGVLTELGNTRQIEVSRTEDGRRIAAITARECGLYLIDVTDPAKPYICCHYNTVEFATGVAFHGHHLAIGCRSFGVEIIDVSTPESPRHLSTIRAGEVQSVCVDNGILFTGSWGERQVNVIDITDVTAPRKLATIPLEGRGDGLTVKNGILYAAFGQHLSPCTGKDPEEYGYGRGNGFAIWDVSNPQSPEKLSVTLFEHRYYYCTYDYWDVMLCGHYAIVSHTFNGVWIYDVSDLTAPVLVDHIAVVTKTDPSEVLVMDENTMRLHPMVLPFDHEKIMYAPVTGIAAADGRLYVSVRFENLHIAYADYFSAESEKTEVSGEVIGDYYLRYPGDDCVDVKIVPSDGQVHAAAYLNDRIWAACGMDGVRVYDKELVCIGHHATDGFAMDIREHGGLLYVAAGKAGLIILQPEGDALRELGRYDFGGPACAQVVPTENGRFLMAHIDDQHYSILDVSDPAAPRELVRDTDKPGLLYHRQLSRDGVGGKYYGFYLNGNDTRWYDLSGDTPIFTDWHQGRLGFKNGMTGLPEEYLSLAVVNAGYVIADIREPELYIEREIIRIPGVRLAGKPVVFGNTLVLSDRLKGDVFICDISDIRAPRLIKQLNFSGHPDMVCPIDDGCIVIPLGHQGIALVKFR